MNDNITKFLITVLSIILSVIFRGICLVKLWLCFVVPLGAPAITMSHAFGISLLVGMFFNKTQNNSFSESTSTSTLVSTLGTIILSPLFILLAGYIIKSIMN